MPYRSLQRRLKSLVGEKRLLLEGRERGSRYRVQGTTPGAPAEVPTAGAQLSVFTETEFMGLLEGNFARYRVRLSEYAAWRAAWRLAAHELSSH